MSMDAHERIRKSHAQLSTEMAGLYVQGVVDGLFVSMPPQMAGRLIQDTIMSAARTLIADDRTLGAEEVTDSLRGFLLRGLSR